MAMVASMPRPRVRYLVPFCILILIWIYATSSRLDSATAAAYYQELEEFEEAAASRLGVPFSSKASSSSSPKGPRVELVVSATKATNTSWLSEYFPHLPAHIYVADDPNAPLTVERNVGHESNVYLTYIIDNYDKLPDVAIFLHGRRYQWHNEDPTYDGVPPLQKLRIPYVLEHGFSTLRCSWLLGCPLEITPDPWAETKWDDPDADQRAKTEAVYAAAFQELFPHDPVPNGVGSHCGAQFAVTRERVLGRSRRDYVNYRDWLWATELTDEFSGRVMEYSWHQIMGQPAVDCPDAGRCFCEKFGMCDLVCKEFGCAGTYFFNFGELPERWPEVGWRTKGWPAKGWWDFDPLWKDGESNAKYAAAAMVPPPQETGTGTGTGTPSVGGTS